MDDDNTLVTVNEAARRLNRSIEQVRRYLREGKLLGKRIGGQWFIDVHDLDSRENPPQAAPGMVREVAAMEYTATSTHIDQLIARVTANRERIRSRLGGDIPIDIVELIRKDREEH